jgi:hypothetical protein
MRPLPTQRYRSPAILWQTARRSRSLLAHGAPHLSTHIADTHGTSLPWWQHPDHLHNFGSVVILSQGAIVLLLTSFGSSHAKQREFVTHRSPANRALGFVLYGIYRLRKLRPYVSSLRAASPALARAYVAKVRCHDIIIPGLHHDPSPRRSHGPHY